MIVCDSYDIFQALLLSIIKPGSVGVGVEGKRVEVAEDWYKISKCRCRGGQPPDPGVRGPCNSHKGPPSQQQPAAGVLFVVRCPTDLVTLLHYDEVALLTSFDGVDGVDGVDGDT